MVGEWLKRRYKLVTSGLLGKAVTPDLPFVQPDGTLYCLDTDFSGKKRDMKNPAPGPFREIKDGLTIIKVWEKLRNINFKENTLINMNHNKLNRRIV
jgi:hypothetical protein